MLEKDELKRGRRVYWGRVVVTVNQFDVVPLTIYNVKDDYFTAIPDISKFTYLFNYPDLNTVVFETKYEADCYIEQMKKKYWNPEFKYIKDLSDE